jgi:hypothetical protein|tara:strand:- start:140 stop:652 length:513 start_codon:yes stop_codon:yes gene_type:complete
MITYKNFIDDFSTIATNHFLINSFHSGLLDEVDIEKLDESNFPILYVEPGTTTADTGMLTYNFNVFVMNKIKEDLSNREEVWSEMLQIMQDIISEFKQNLSLQRTGGDSGKKYSYVPGEVVLETPIDMEPFSVRFANMLTGWNATLTLEVNNPNSLCDAPIEPSDENANL